jgi:hypothetical protein
MEKYSCSVVQLVPDYFHWQYETHHCLLAIPTRVTNISDNIFMSGGQVLKMMWQLLLEDMSLSLFQAALDTV